MKIYKNVIRTALAVLLVANFCYGAEKKQQGEGTPTIFTPIVITDDYAGTTEFAQPRPSSSATKILSTQSPADKWAEAASSLQKQLDMFIKTPPQPSIKEKLRELVTSQKDQFVVQIEENKSNMIKNINHMIDFVEKNGPTDKKLGATLTLKSVLNAVESNNIKALNNTLTQLERVVNDIASFIPTEPTKEHPQQIVLLPRKEETVPALKEQERKSFSEAIKPIYNLELQIQEELTALENISRQNPSEAAPHRLRIIEKLSTLAQLLQNPYKESHKPLGTQLTKTLLIARTLHNFHYLELDKTRSTKTFVTNFIKIADLIPGIVFDKVDQEFIQYILQSPFFYDNFVTLRLVPEEKKKAFDDAYLKIFNTVYPPIIPEIPEEPVINYPQPQENENLPGEDIVPNKPIIEQEPIIKEFDLERSNKAAMPPKTEIEQIPAKREIEPEFKPLPLVAENLEENIVEDPEKSPTIFTPIEPKIERSKQLILNPYKKPIILESEAANPFSKESKELYDREKEIQKILKALEKTIEEGTPTTLLKNYLRKKQFYMTELLENKPINLTIQITKALQNFHPIELDMITDQEDAVDTESFVANANSFTDNFIKIAELISSDTNEYDQDLIEYILESPVFDRYFITKKLVQRSRQEEFDAAYKTIHNALYPAAIETTQKIVEQSKREISPVAVIPHEQEINPELKEMKPDQKTDATPSPIEADQNNPQVAVGVTPAQPAAQPTPSFWSSYIAPVITRVSNGISNAWQGIKNFFGGITSTLFGPKVPSTEIIPEKNAPRTIAEIQKSIEQLTESSMKKMMKIGPLLENLTTRVIQEKPEFIQDLKKELAEISATDDLEIKVELLAKIASKYKEILGKS